MTYAEIRAASFCRATKRGKQCSQLTDWYELNAKPKCLLTWVTPRSRRCNSWGLAASLHHWDFFGAPCRLASAALRCLLVVIAVPSKKLFSFPAALPERLFGSRVVGGREVEGGRWPPDLEGCAVVRAAFDTDVTVS